jgi:hypothetical protein
MRWVALDMRNVGRPQDWLPHLSRVDAVINCAGVCKIASAIRRKLLT